MAMHVQRSGGSSVVRDFPSAAHTPSEGGVVVAGAGTADDPSLAIPPGALAADTTITIRTEAASVAGLPPGVVPLGDVLVIEPATLTFQAGRPATLSLPVPTSLPADTVLAIVELPAPATVAGKRGGASKQTRSSDSPMGSAGMQSLNLRRLAANKGPGGVRMMAPGDPLSVACTSSENFSDGKVNVSVNGAKRVLKAAVSPSQCTSFAPAPPSGGVPSDTDQPCTKDDEFVALSGSSREDQSLVSRHVACYSSAASTSGNSVFADLKEVNGQFVFATAQDIAARTFTSQLVGNFADAEVQVSLHGPSTGLTKTVSIRARVKNFQNDNSYTGPSQALTSIKVRPLVSCFARGASDGNLCTIAPVVLDVPLNGNWSARREVSIAFNWPAPTVGADDVEQFQVSLQRFFYVANGSVDRVDSESSLFDTNYPYGIEVRCDRGAAKARTNGCVLPLAAAVFSLKSSDTAVAKSRQHISDALATVPGITGRFALLQGTRAVADESGAGTLALTRTRITQRINNNRAESNKRCKEIFGPVVAPAPEVCPVVLDPDEDEGPCDCDEYPFASSEQGAFSEGPLSVRRIPQSDNRSAGAKLGEFYRKQRVIDAEEFWVAVP
jgi:hypothetical protein